MTAPDAPSKLTVAAMAAGALAYLLMRQGDAVGLQTFPVERSTFLPPRGPDRTHSACGARGAARDCRPDGTARPDEGIRRATDTLRRRGLLLVFSDFYDDEDGTRRRARREHAPWDTTWRCSRW